MSASTPADETNPAVPAVKGTQANPFVLGSRASKLALIQANLVMNALRHAHPSLAFTIATVSVEGDRNKSQALYLLGGKSLWTKELEVALLDGEVDIIVHSLKDVPTTLPEGCVLGAVVAREDPRDSLVVKEGLGYKTLQDLPEGSVVGTSSVRRVAQLRRSFPHLLFQDVRGNLDTRMSKLDAPSGPYTALILAHAGLARMGWAHRISSDLSAPEFLHAVGQGALGIEVREGDKRMEQLLKGVGEETTEWCTAAERAMLRVLEGGCSVPVGAATSLQNISSNESEAIVQAKLTLQGSVTSLDGSVHVQKTVERTVRSAQEAKSVGEECARLLVEAGAGSILEEIGQDRQGRAEKVTEEMKGAEGVPQ
ncbi:porphobilinogen deaminase [Calocera viscosa TUFC12733]|uniref:Porphobilinogen deaminase n=1 Tax=Calocera viscosa (strain TUFC12733) TaxID=1330018 RepID=A0A167QIC3_CALVF|nr:porphobilinogen deaminase [Calocera viscosa TUFC12733]